MFIINSVCSDILVYPVVFDEEIKSVNILSQ